MFYSLHTFNKKLKIGLCAFESLRETGIDKLISLKDAKTGDSIGPLFAHPSIAIPSCSH
jgi:hypothetical protein